MAHSNWSIYIEGIGETHACAECDANMFMLQSLRDLKKHHQILQARFTSARGEENWLDPMLLEMHEGFEEKALADVQGKARVDVQTALAGAELVSPPHPADSAPSLHEELVAKGEAALKKDKESASEKQGPNPVGLRKRGEKYTGGQSSKRVYSSNPKDSV